ncbi:unnamed protein product [Protopolystoma xenopodis]|uniref:Uncharacterized protein n=1 Tax=Protopolystoma xenopodis TaxID=117903 RepID=A0A3S5B7L8_9PLAT|nr:unnamed protein product [Protopolystoma xenopodis]
MAKLTDDANYDAGETFENVPSRLADAGNHDNCYGRRFRSRCVLPSRPDNKAKLRQRGQPTFINRKETATIPEATTSWSSYLQPPRFVGETMRRDRDRPLGRHSNGPLTPDVVNFYTKLQPIPTLSSLGFLGVVHCSVSP